LFPIFHRSPTEPATAASTAAFRIDRIRRRKGEFIFGRFAPIWSSFPMLMYDFVDEFVPERERDVFAWGFIEFVWIRHWGLDDDVEQTMVVVAVKELLEFSSHEIASSATPIWCKIISPRYPHTRHPSFVEGTKCGESCLWRS
jgi:hypothetical protein